jgi:pyridoxamine 5'-phosphate oxidase
MSETGPGVSSMRIVYDKDELLEKDLADTPLAQFNKWLGEVVAVGPDVIIEPNAMVLATADANSTVTTRSVLLKGVDGRGLSFYSNYTSRKAQAMIDNPKVSVTFPWYPLHRQVNVVGSVTKLSREESQEYFYSRPHKSQLGAIVSAQSEAIESRDVLETEMARLEALYPEGTQVPMSDNWGGYLITVDSMEFWQGRRSRLHDRLRFVKTGQSSDLGDAGAWKVIRVSP